MHGYITPRFSLTIRPWLHLLKIFPPSHSSARTPAPLPQMLPLHSAHSSRPAFYFAQSLMPPAGHFDYVRSPLYHWLACIIMRAETKPPCCVRWRYPIQWSHNNHSHRVVHQPSPAISLFRLTIFTWRQPVRLTCPPTRFSFTWLQGGFRA